MKTYEIDSRLFYQEVKSNSAEIETAVNRQETNRSSLKKKLANQKNISISITQNHSFQGGFLQAKCFSNSTNERKSQKEWGEGTLADERELSLKWERLCVRRGRGG